MRYTKVYADEAGETHFGEVELPTTLGTFPTSPSRELLSAPIPVRGVYFREIVDDHPPDEPHCAPARIFIVHLRGAVEVTVSDGERREFGPGSIVLMDDTHGKGHRTRSIGEVPRVTLIVQLEPDGTETGAS
jgi:hypothetical protein